MFACSGQRNVECSNSVFVSTGSGSDRPENVNTVNSPLTDTLVSGQLYLRTAF